MLCPSIQPHLLPFTACTVYQGVCERSVDWDSSRATDSGAHAASPAAASGHQYRSKEWLLSTHLGSSICIFTLYSASGIPKKRVACLHSVRLLCVPTMCVCHRRQTAYSCTPSNPIALMFACLSACMHSVTIEHTHHQSCIDGLQIHRIPKMCLIVILLIIFFAEMHCTGQVPLSVHQIPGPFLRGTHQTTQRAKILRVRHVGSSPRALQHNSCLSGEKGVLFVASPLRLIPALSFLWRASLSCLPGGRNL